MDILANIGSDNDMKFIYEDIINIKGHIVQQVNCQNKMGSGLAKTIYEKYPKVKQEYHKFCNKHNESKELLGKVLFVGIDKNTRVCNMFSQLNYGYDGKRYTDYKTFQECFEIVCLNSPHKIYVPYKIGCGLGGADWNIIEEILKNLEIKYKKEIIIVRKDN